MIDKIAEFLGDKAQDLLEHQCSTIAKDMLHVPGPDYIDRVFIDSDRNNRVLVSLERFLRSVGDAKSTLTYLARNPRAAEILVTLFAGSAYLTETLLRNPEYFELLATHQRLTHAKSVEQFRADAQ